MVDLPGSAATISAPSARTKAVPSCAFIRECSRRLGGSVVMLPGVRAARRLSNDRPSADSSRFYLFGHADRPTLEAGICRNHKKWKRLSSRLLTKRVSLLKTLKQYDVVPAPRPPRS